MACAHDTAPPGGYDAEVGQRRVNLGGQKQRIAIARFACPARYPHFDDSTMLSTGDGRPHPSGVEAETQRTTFVVAQRISTVSPTAILVLMMATRRPGRTPNCSPPARSIK